MVVDSLRIVAAPPEQEAAAAEAHAGPSPSQEPPAPALTRAMETVHHMFQEGLSLQEIAAARGVTISTVVDYVIKAAGFGLAVDWKRLAGALQLGPKDSVSGTWVALALTVGTIAGQHAGAPRCTA